MKKKYTFLPNIPDMTTKTPTIEPAPTFKRKLSTLGERYGGASVVPRKIAPKAR